MKGMDWLDEVKWDERGLVPDLEVEEPEVEFGAEPPAGDATLDKAIDRLDVELLELRNRVGRDVLDLP